VGEIRILAARSEAASGVAELFARGHNAGGKVRIFQKGITAKSGPNLVGRNRFLEKPNLTYTTEIHT